MHVSETRDVLTSTCKVIDNVMQHGHVLDNVVYYIYIHMHRFFKIDEQY